MAFIVGINHPGGVAVLLAALCQIMRESLWRFLWVLADHLKRLLKIRRDIYTVVRKSEIRYWQ